MPGVWKKTLVYLGLAEEDEGYEDYEHDRAVAGDEARAQHPVHRISEVDRHRDRRDAVVRAMPIAPKARFHLVHPDTFDDAQEIGDKFRDGYSVLMNLQEVDRELGRRLIDFASGLAYGLGGGMQPVAENVFLITPHGVQVSAEERKRFLEERGFFNQA